MGLIRRPVRATAVAVAGLAITALTSAFSLAGDPPPTPSAGPRFVAISGSVTPTRDTITGGYHSSRMTVEVALAPRNPAALNHTLRAIYTAHSGLYHHWLATGQFDARFAPAAATRAAVARYLSGSGLTVQRVSSPFLVRATGSSQRVSAAFRTTLSTFRNPKGARYFANSTPVRLPSTLAPEVLGVIGLSNTLRMHAMAVPARELAQPAGNPSGSKTSCQLPYPSFQFLLTEVLNGVPNTSIPRGYGGGPGCSGLTPAQTNSIYGAPGAGPRGKGAGVTMAVFELVAYQQSDVTTWAHEFYGRNYTPPLADINVDGGPLNPACPAGDFCVPGSQAYYLDIEADADIEMQLTISPAARQIQVYNAPNDAFGITPLDEYARIASDNTASVISSSWAVCERDAGAAYEQAQNVIFEQMAAQGQSMFAATGDTGAFACIRDNGSTVVNVWDPAAQPWVTAVGGTSLESFNPGSHPHPSYPAGVETVWNVDNLCNTGSNEGLPSNLDWCALMGAGGGGSSQVFGRPFYQQGPGVDNPYTTTGCALAAAGTPCREIPDVSANADVFTPYAEYCTGNANTPGSFCGTFSASQNVPGWFGIGGTSLSSPLWSGIIADRDSFQGFRSGNVNPLLYVLFNTAPQLYFNDITGIGQSTNNNGLFPTTPGYDLATGIGTPKMAALITGKF